jgi:hypothetical protein
MGFSWWQVRRWLSFGLQHSAVWWKFTDVSEVLVASIIRAVRFGKLPPDCTALQSRRQPSSKQYNLLNQVNEFMGDLLGRYELTK